MSVVDDLPYGAIADLTRLGTDTRRCRICSCTEYKACVDEKHGPCWWIEADLCSHCGETPIVLAEYEAMLARQGAGKAVTIAELDLWARKARAALQHATLRSYEGFEL